MVTIVRAIIQLLMNWRAILAMAVLVVSTGFSGKIFLKQAGDSLQSAWWIIALVCVVIIAKEFLRGYWNIKKEQVPVRKD